MNKSSWLRVGLVVMLVGSLFLVGCDDERARAVALQGLDQAQKDLNMVRDMGGEKYARESFSLAEIKYTEGKGHVDDKNYTQAMRDWEDFQLLLSKSKSETLIAKDRAEHTKATAAALEAERQRLAALEQQRLADEAAKKLAQTPPPVVAPVPVPAPVVAAPAEESTVWVVKRGDTLCKIARANFQGNYMKWKFLFRLNRKSIKNPNLIYPGQKFVVKKVVN